MLKFKIIATVVLVASGLRETIRSTTDAERRIGVAYHRIGILLAIACLLTLLWMW